MNGPFTHPFQPIFKPGNYLPFIANTDGAVAPTRP